ncbi:MAG TPA: Hpt domain-containing protein, partial [Gemmatimonadaceae bacterium]
MTAPSPAGFLDFFVLEASEYVEQLDGLLLAGGQEMPDGDSMLRTARALRGSATMAKLAPFADLAAALERVTRGLREGGVPWSPALRGVLVAAVDDLKILVRAARGWSEADTQRAAGRAAELLGHAPATSQARPTPAGGSNLEFLARETGNIAAGIELLLTARPDRATAGNVLQRVRAMRGIAALRDVPGLSPVLEGAEEGLAPMERADGLPSQPQRELLQAVVSILRDAGASLRNGQLPAIEGAPLVFLERALDAWQESAAAAETIVPVSALFPADGSGVVSESQHPPTTPDARFRLELVGHGEHLQRIVSEARGNADPTARERVRRVIRQALRATRALAESFGRTPVANSVSDVADMATVFDERALSLLGEVAGVLSRAATGGEPVEPALASVVARHREMGAGAPTPVAPIAAVPAAPIPPLPAPTP